MPHYLVLLNWTEQGIRNVKDSPARLDAAREATRRIGGEIKAFYMLMGEYDLGVVVEAPDDAAAARFLLTMGAQGHVRSKTLRAFTEAEYREICAHLG